MIKTDIFKAIVGSHSFGTNIETSDTDGNYIQ
jgi:predicted nucleotidyltransferase